MEDSFIEQLFAERIGGDQFGKSTMVYKFEKIKQAKRAARVAHKNKELIDLGVGEPDSMADATIIKTLGKAAQSPENRFYADNGGDAFKQAVADFMKTVFNVSLDPQTEVLHSIGSKSALSLLPAAFINPQDVVLTTTPGYPIFGIHAEYYQGKVFNYPLSKENDFLPQLEMVPQDILKRAKILLLNYPNNPTGGFATRAFFEKAVQFAKKHSLIIVQDAAYSALNFLGEENLSILEIPRAKEVAIELHSLSKSFNMTGWRLGWVCGNAKIIKAYGHLKDNSDSGQFLAIQEAGCTALANPNLAKENAKKYSRRAKGLEKIITAVGFEKGLPKGGFFIYKKAPKKAVRKTDGVCFEFESAEAVSEFLIRELLISTVPWDDVGSYTRFSLTFEAETIQEEERVLQTIAERLDKYDFSF